MTSVKTSTHSSVTSGIHKSSCWFAAHGPAIRIVLLLTSIIVGWAMLYRNLTTFSLWLTYTVFKFPRETGGAQLGLNGCCVATEFAHQALSPAMREGRALAFLLFQLPHTFLLLGLVVFFMGIVRSFFSPERTRRLLATPRHAGAGQLLAAALGVVTPFCSCSAAPLFVGFVTAGVPLGVTFTFLVAAPLVNEIALALLWDTFGWQIALVYLLIGVEIALITGWCMQRFRMERYLEEWVKGMAASSAPADSVELSWHDRLQAGGAALREIVGRVWRYVLAGILVGTLIFAVVPQATIIALLGARHWWSVPLAVAIGVPIYANAAGILPLVQALLAKGAALGTVLAFTMAVVALSLPEFIILRKVMRLRLLFLFAGIVSAGILIVGWVFNWFLS
jgi:uncharacterized membrane protein YraQ (UPF0718 family)